MKPGFVKADGGPKFVHPCCVCGAWGAFGYGVKLREAIAAKNPDAAGTWFCFEHKPDKRAG